MRLKNKLKYDFSRIISHLGFGMLIMFIGLNNSLSEDNDFNLKIGETKSLKNQYSLTNTNKKHSQINLSNYHSDLSETFF